MLASSVVVVGSLTYFSWLGAYLGASLFGKDVARSYTPLVRHQISQQHCYDDGSQLCEKAVGKQGSFAKEFTIAYLFRQKPYDGLATDTLYVCGPTSRRASAATLDPATCKSAGQRAYRLGFIAKTADFEAPVALFACQLAAAEDVLITDDENECTLAGYGTATKLGYAASAGYLSRRRLEGLCAVIAPQCPQSATSPVCQAAHTFCPN